MTDDPAPKEEIIKIDDLPADLTEALHLRARENGNSLEQEIRTILEEHLDQGDLGID